MRKVICLILAAVMLLGTAGCASLGEVAGNVAQAAMKELEGQLKGQLEKHKIEVVETKTAFGELNDEGGKVQFFLATLVKTENTEALQKCVDALDSVFAEKGWAAQTGSKVESDKLVKKEITFKHSNYSDGNYYVIYGYAPDVTGGVLDKKN